jgi:hypothetical protein
VPCRDPTLRPIGVARQIDRKIHASVDVTPGRGEEPAHPIRERAASPGGRRTRNEPSEDQPPIGIERRDLTESLDRTTFVVHRDDDAATVGSVRKEHERHSDPPPSRYLPHNRARRYPSPPDARRLPPPRVSLPAPPSRSAEKAPDPYTPRRGTPDPVVLALRVWSFCLLPSERSPRARCGRTCAGEPSPE